MARDIFSYYSDTELFLEMFINSPKKVQQLLMLPLVEKRLYPDFWNDEEIKSPIEQIFSTAFYLYCKTEDKKQIYLFPQKKVSCNKKTYYIDFVFEADDYLSYLVWDGNIKNKDFKLAIECDGYDFHQKTKEQIQHDNEREYDLKMAGYEILRFSGTQIYNNPLKCAEDTYNYIIKKVEEGK